MEKEKRLQQLNTSSYEQLAQDFDATRFTPWKEMEPIVVDIKDGDSIADIGCGNGRLLKALPSVNFKYVGIDSNNYLLEKARKFYPDHEFRLSDMESLELEENSYDYIFFIASFHHLVTKKARLVLLNKCKKALKGDGVLIISVWTSENLLNDLCLNKQD